jgi:hypothetical protein
VVVATASNFQGLSGQLGSKTIAVATSPVPGPPLGAFGEAVDQSTGAAAVAQNDSLFVKGWAADWHDGAPVSAVTVYIDGVAAGAATLGIQRPDVAATYSNPAFLNSGWTFSVSASGLTVGTHTVSAVATNSLSLSTTLGYRYITVVPGD